MSANVKKFLWVAGLMILGIVVDRKTGGKISGLVAKIPVVGPLLVG